MMTTTATRTDMVRRELYLLRLSWFVQDLRRRERRTIYADLRAALAEASADRGMRGALRDLGPASALGASFRDAQGRRLPRWMSGMVAVLTLVCVYVVGLLSYAAGAIDAVGRGVAERTVSGRWMFTDIEVVSGPDRLAMTTWGHGGTVLVLVVVFVVVARGWRLWTDRPRSA